MMFCKADIYNSYCEWLFDILFTLEPRIDLSQLNDYQKRLFGFLSERLLNVWIIKNEISVRSCPIINTENSRGKCLELLLRRFYHRLNS